MNDARNRATLAFQALDFLKRCATEDGRIVSTGDLTELQISESRMQKRMWVDENGLGYVILPWDLRCTKDGRHR